MLMKKDKPPETFYKTLSHSCNSSYERLWLVIFCDRQVYDSII